MFVDSAKITVKAGNGGNGVVSFRREKYVPAGGPDGGNGGHGGHVIFKVDPSMRTLMDFRYKTKYNAANGDNGGKKNCSGRDGGDLVILVPAGTIIRDSETKLILGDLTDEDDSKIIARGGNGGRGNTEFKSSIRQGPTFAEAGFKGEEREVELELKMIADVGLIGYPNVGKSTILSVVTKARPKIGNYHFTTIKPNLGVVETIRGKSFVMADIPGLIEGASEGVGLGHDFLRHVERTRLLVHVVDISGVEGRDPIEDFEQINQELALYNSRLASRPMVVVGNKLDMVYDHERLEAFKAHITEKELKLFIVSAATQQGLDEVMKYVTEKLDEIPVEELVEVVDVEDLDERANPFEIAIRVESDVYVLEGQGIERLMYSTNFDDMSSLRRFEGYLKKRGIFKKLREMGIEEGQTVRILDFEFEFYD
ncbi:MULTISPECIES: GTPase ObgE [unclassified Fusibacter]|uniref:GTPase ObgE n=1 Tax=unclassified Fusibacter TaxID=2624464 RepID=UPI001010AA0A|nr:MULTISPECIES: GTPase ObgE [unclassified Fusibacter]MCK8060682.1 GTPase ObgE [Fusibacter sp. A2]NPE22864.1 GTPase ObgE [Fusibacter sp. A1]RXV59933.1 GTPase ObgE [Fusibacter sp. A1]